ncbi:MAG TPA: biliverdin-producing heme oxygenase [Longimicrobium sp.]|nr:biliverdin-producing heme oxygenase [Longimicrobium sp.]
MLLAELKSATAEHHARVEAAMPSLDQLATPGGYAAALRALHAFHAAWEPALWRTPGIAAAGLGSGREKLPLMERDLAALGIRPCGALPPAPAPMDAAAALGALYVLEGASLGGRIIHRRVAGPLGVTPEHGAAYYHGYGERTGDRWKEFGRAVTRFADDTGSGPRVVAGAVDCFAALEAWLAVPGVMALPEPATVS